MTDTRSREALIKALRELVSELFTVDGCIVSAAADMLEADARDTAWQRGFQSGVSSNEKTAKDAVAALAVEQAAHRETNRLMTEALMQAEAQQVAVPHGYVLVPIEPTPEMCEAGNVFEPDCCITRVANIRRQYRAMLAVCSNERSE